MSKAFTKDDDDAPPPAPIRRGVAVPEPNYMTPAGARAARAELATTTDEARARELTEHLATAQVLEPPADRGSVSLGAEVTVEDESGARTVYRLVGALEADPRRGWISWQSPIAQALYGARVGDTIARPRGGDAEVIAIAYP